MRADPEAFGWRGALLVAVVYIYFLIFAQFGFLARLSELGISVLGLKIVLAIMAAGGILFSLATPRVRLFESPALRLRVGFALCVLGALASLLPLNTFGASVIAFSIGSGLGIATVTLATHLRGWTGRRPFLEIGLGVGAGYLVCNIPTIFAGSPQFQTSIAALLCFVAIVIVKAPSSAVETPVTSFDHGGSFLPFLASFAALVWLDSAAFYIIQHTPTLKSGTWMGNTHLWINGGLHLAGAIAAALLLKNGRVIATLSVAFLCLAFACLLLSQGGLILSASLFYPFGVSLYSVALVCYPAFLTRKNSAADRARHAGWIYAIAGWVGSALGIGMGQNLGHVPMAFVIVAGIVVLAPAVLRLLQTRSREAALIASVLVLATLIARSHPATPQSPPSAAEHGRQIYISEGCISCHSQYVRPNTADVLMWGPASTPEEVRLQQPPLIGNRRQGPDLARVGMRRSPQWLKAHLLNPAEMSSSSIMPSYAFLFRDGRGDDLVAYLSTLTAPESKIHASVQAAWQPSALALKNATPDEGKETYETFCANCHDSNGLARHNLPARSRDLTHDLTGSGSALPSPPQLARIAKFGITATDMPGHEYLSDRQIVSLTEWLTAIHQTPHLRKTLSGEDK